MWLLTKSQWKSIDSLFTKLLPIVLSLLVLYLYLSFFDTSVPALYKSGLQYIIITFFTLEIIVKYQFYEDRITFLKNEWINILLVFPFLKTLKLFKAFGAVGKAIKTVKFIPYIQKGVKIPKVVKKWKKKRKK